MLKRALQSVFLFFCPLFLFAVEALYLTYPDNPCNSIAIHWIEKAGTKSQEVLYRKASDVSWVQASSDTEILEGKYVLSKCVLNNLEKDTQYFFRLTEEIQEYSFTTLYEKIDIPLVIAIGGDAYQKAGPYREMNQQVANKSPDFVILAGDIAYANQGNAIERWVDFFRIWYETMRMPRGDLIPLVVTVGNHDILPKKKASEQLFLNFFPYLEKGSYGLLEVNKNACFFLLDTGHIAPIEGRQTEWLKQAFENKKDTQYKIPVYHIAAYPSIYKYEKENSALIRNCWCPLFDLYNVFVAFENHNHAFKRTVPICKGEQNSAGVVYIGDGCWSADVRKKTDTRWYLEKRISTHAFSLLTLTDNELMVESFNNKGALIDSWKKQ
jgi:hypothetical protein